MSTKSPISISRRGQFAATGFINANGQQFCQLELTITGDELVVGRNQHQGELAGVAVQPRILAGLTTTATCLYPVQNGTTLEALQKAVDGANEAGATLYARISPDVTDILGDNQLAVMGQPNRPTRAQYEESNKVVNPTNNEFMGYYRQFYFSPVPKADVDLRGRAAAPSTVTLVAQDTTTATTGAADVAATVPAAAGAEDNL